MSGPPTASRDPASTEVFDAARRRAFVQSILAELSGRSDDLLSFDEVRQKLRLGEPASDVSVREIPLDRIVGSVGRYRDFNRAFLPRAHIDPARWSRIAQLYLHAALPPIDVFGVGDVYFVRDGNHRVSVARARKHKTIRARVVDIPVRVPVGADTSPDDLILKAGYASFLEKTSLDRIFPNQRIELTRAGGYVALLKHIEVHQFYMGLRSRYYPTLAEASADWYQTVYLPVVEQIVASGVLRHFPRRTEADLYVWIAENRVQLQMQYGARKQARVAVDSFAQEHRGPRLGRWMSALCRRLRPRDRTVESLLPAPGGRGENQPGKHENSA